MTVTNIFNLIQLIRLANCQMASKMYLVGNAGFKNVTNFIRLRVGRPEFYPYSQDSQSVCKSEQPTVVLVELDGI
jgi:hypothetical protein